MTKHEHEYTALNLADIVAAMNLIDTAVTRGAYKMDELDEVTSVYSKLKSFTEQNIENLTGE